MPTLNAVRLLERLEGLTAQRDDEPGVAVSVIRGAHVIARRHVGLASLPHRVPIGPRTRFHIVSVSKTFMAAAVLMLAARGALALDDDVRRHLPELPAEVSPAGALTIRHLLSMTSGLCDVLEIERLRGVWGTAPSRTRDLLDLAGRISRVSAPPGTQYMYANVNALLLDELVARVSGISAEAFRRAAVYEPLGLADTAARPHEGLVVPELAEPYVPDGAGGWSRATNLLGIAADTLTTSPADLTRWVLALRAGEVGGVAVTAAMAEQTRLCDGTRIHYGLGLAVRRYRGLTVLCHSGSQPGYKAHIAYVPERDVGVVILSNREDTRAAALAAAILEEAIGRDFPGPHPAAEARRRVDRAGFTPEQQAALAGSYVDVDAGEWMSLAIEDGVLRGETLGDPVTFYHDGGGVFRDADDYRATVPAELRIQFAHDGGVTCMLRLGGQDMVLRRHESPWYTPEALAAFAGCYESGVIDSRHRVRVHGAGLVVEYGLGGDGGRAFAMKPIAPDVFLVEPTGPGIAYRHVFRFERDGADVVVGAVVTMERLKGVRLDRTARPAGA
jgi:D-aminopeptidase